MKTIELTRTNGTMAQITFGYEAGDAFAQPSVLSVKTAEVEIREAALMTKSDVKLKTRSVLSHASDSMK